MTAPLDEHAATIPAPAPPDGCHEDEHGAAREEMLPPPPTERSRR